MALLDFLFGRTKPTPTTSTTIATSKLPEEIGPAAKTVIDEAEALYRQAVEEGYKEFPGEMIAPRTAEELAAIEGLRSLVGGQEPYRAEAEQALRATPTQFTADEAQRLMSPYQRAVTDIEKREAQRAFERDVQPAIEAKAIRAGGMSGLGTRAGLQAAEAQRQQSQLLADIEAKGQQRAFEQAYRQFGDETAAQRQRSQDIGQLGTQRFNIGLAEQGLAQQLGQADRAEAQAILADQYAEFIEREQFPETELAQFSSFVNQSPFVQQGTKTTTDTKMLQPTSSIGQQLLGLGLTGLNIYGRGGGFNQSAGGFSPNMFFTGQRKKGGSVGSGLTSLPVINRRTPGQVMSARQRVQKELAQRQENLQNTLRIGTELQNIQGARRRTEEAIAAEAKKRAEEKAALDKRQAEARSGLTTKGLEKLAVGTDTPIGADFGRAAKAVLSADPNMGIVGLLGLAGAEAVEGMDEKLKERNKILRENAKTELELNRNDQAVQQAAEAANLSNKSKEALRALREQGELEIGDLEVPKKERKQVENILTTQLTQENLLMEAEADYLKAKNAGKVKSDQSPTAAKKQGLESILANYRYTLDEKGRLAFIGEGEGLKPTDPKFKEMQQARKLYEDTFTKYLVRQNKNKGFIDYLDAENANKAARNFVYIKYPTLAGATPRENN